MRINIGGKLIALFLLVAMAPLVIVGWVAYRQATNAIREIGYDRLDTLAHERAHRIDHLFEDRALEVALLSLVPSIASGLQEYERVIASAGADSAQYRAVDDKYRTLLSAFALKGGVYDVFLIGREGDIVFTVARESDFGTNLRTGPYKDTELAHAFELAIEGAEIGVSEIQYYEPSDAPAAFLATAVQVGERTVGVLAVQMTDQEINSLAEDYAGLGETGETVLASRRGDQVIFLAPTRHDPSAAFARKVVFGSASALPAQEASDGRNGIGEYVDYRGEPVLAAWRHVPFLRLGMVVKLDEREAFAPIRALATWFLLLGLGTLLVVFCVSLILSRSISNPIVALTRITGLMAAGDLTVRADIRGGDEIGALSRAFNDMGAALSNASKQSEETDWLKTGLSQLSSALSGDPSLEMLAAKAISAIAKYLHAQVGAFYVAQDGAAPALMLTGSYAYTKRKNLSNVFKPGEGLVGQAALEKQQILLKNVPEDYVRVTSGLGDGLPRYICVTPFLYEGNVKGVIEIGTLNEMSDRELEYLSQAMPTLAVTVQSAENRTNLNTSLEESQRLSAELQVQQEELRTTNEELEQQAQRLKESEERLKAQQEELQVSNEELEEKNELLERQKQEVEQARQELEEKAEELALASRYKSEFLANMSHELRTPLNSLLLLAQSLTQNKDGNLTDEQVESAQIIHGSGSDLLNLINEILDLSKIEAGRIDLQLATVRIADLADGVRASFQHVVKEKELALNVVVQDEAPGEITSDRKRVEQVIRNLLSNALKFTEQGSVSVAFGRPVAGTDLSRSELSVGTCLAIEVKDTGIGIAANQQRSIFEAFQQADGSTARKYGGTGLGLSISRELVRLLGGEIQLQSEADKGSIFTVYLPLASSAGPMSAVNDRSAVDTIEKGQRPATQQSSATQIEDDRDSLQKDDRVILVIEDDPKFARLVVKKCHEKGFKCLAAPTGEVGVELAQKHVPGGVILDLGLPGMDGWAVLNVLKESTRTRHIPVHIASVEEASIEALRRGAVGHVTKPLDQEDLESTLLKLERVSTGRPKRVLVVDDDSQLRRNTVKLISDGEVTVDEADTGEQALQALRSGSYECVILDLGLPDMDGGALLAKLEGEGTTVPPVIVHTARDLTTDEEADLRMRAESIVIKDVRSQERLIDEVSLFLHRVVSRMPEEQRQVIRDLHDTDAGLRGKKVLIVDDDMRTTFALSRLLSARGMQPLKAENGERALRLLDSEPDVDLVLMDIMMPTVDGYEAMRRIRTQDRFRKLPIIALTAKAMPADAEKCLAAGASDYLPKPVDEGRLVSMMRVWLYR